jgi:tryptophan synthase alpha chain
VERYLQRLQNMQLKNPVLVGFGIKDKQSFQSACQYANGAIIGTAFIQAIGNADDTVHAAKTFLDSVLK